VDMPAYIDIYCERVAPGFWNEPVNALTNAAFLVAAWWAWRDARRLGGATPAETGLIGLAGLIGVGSFLFHTIPNGWTVLADVVPIWAFVAGYVLLAIHRMGGESPARTARVAGIAAIVLVAVFALNSGDVTAETVPAADPFNGSLQYLPAVLAFVGFIVATQLRKHPARNWILGAGGVFVLSLTFRTVDLAACPATGIGTHFLWHLLNGLMIGLLLQALIRHMPPRRRSPLAGNAGAA